MDCFKIKTGIGSIYPISERNVIRMLGKGAPYYRVMPNGRESFFAVCPCCENPIQIVGIFKNTKEAGRKPYGKHCKGSIPQLAEYCQEDYYNCPYSKPQKKERNTDYRSADSRVAQASLHLLAEQFDRVIYILSKDMEVRISQSVAEEMLKSYVNNKGWLYRDSTLNNLPWKLAESARGIKLFGRLIYSGGLLEQALRDKCPEVELVAVDGTKHSSPLLQIKNRDGCFVNLRYVMYDHQVTTDENREHIEETIVFRVYRGEAPNIETVFEKTIPIRTDYFMNLIDSKKETYRNPKLLQMAKSFLEPYLKRR